MISFIIETICVGLYTFALYYIIHNYFVIFDSFFYLGFFKHLLGYFLSLWSLYCNLHCNKKNVRISSYLQLLLESLLEGFLFWVMYQIIVDKNISNYFIAFFIGSLLHILSESFGLHNYFCRRCFK